MEYIKGFVHDSFTETYYYELNMDFTFVVCNVIGYYDLTGVYTEINQETLMSRDFITANANWDIFQIDRINGKLLLNVTREFNRDNKIDLILK